MTTTRIVRMRRRRALAAVLAAAGVALLATALPTMAFPSAAPGSRALQAVPVLMYHVVSAPPKGAPYPWLYVTRGEFAAQMRWLAQHGFAGVTLQQVYDSWLGRGVLPARPIVISFDDGYRSQFTNALPILRRHGWRGVLNLDLSNLTGLWDLSPGMIRELVAAGWEIDAHSLTHPDLRTLGRDALRREVAGSRAEIGRRFSVPANFFCYPSGRFDDEVLAAVKAAGYHGATTTEFGLARASELFTLDRVRVDAGDGVQGLARKLAGLFVTGA